MKKTFVTALALMVSWGICAQTIEVTPGNLQQTLGNNAATAVSLSLRGNADARDLAFLATMPALRQLNMAELNISSLRADKEIIMNRRQYPANTLPAFVFALSKLEKITLPATLTEIEECAFASSSNLKEVTIGNSVRHIGDWAFYATSLTTVTLPASVDSLGQGIFANCLSLATANLAAGALKILPAKAFRGCSALKTITFPSALVKIGDECLLGSGLENVDLPESVTSTGHYAFSSMPSLQTASTANANLGRGALFSNQTLTTHQGNGVIPELGLAGCTSMLMSSTDSRNLVSLGDFALADNQSYILTFGENLEYVGRHALDGMVNLHTVHNYDLHGNIPMTDEGAFNGISNIGEVKLWVDTIYHPYWTGHAEWGRFNVSPTTVGVEGIENETGTDANISCQWNAGILNIRSSENITSVGVYDTAGMMLAMAAPGADQAQIDLSASSQQIIIVKVNTTSAQKIFKLLRNN